MSVTIKEISRTLTIGVEGATATREVELAGADEAEFLTELFNPSYVENVGYEVRRRAQHPAYNWMSLREVAIKPAPPEEPPATGTTYRRIRATLTYEADVLTGTREPPTSLPGTTLTWTTEGSAEMMSIPRSNLVWDADNEPVGHDVDVGIVVPTVTHSLRWSNVLDPPFERMRQYIGQVNVAEFLGAAPETLLFAGYTTETTFNQDEELVYSMTYAFIEKTLWENGQAKGWNHFWRADAAAGQDTWQRLKQQGNNKRPYEMGALNLLIQPGQ